MNSVFARLVFFVLVVQGGVALANGKDQPDLSLVASFQEASNKISFKLTNISGAQVEVERDFSHWQNMYLVIKRERPFHEIVVPRSYATDPAVGTYVLNKRGQYVEETLDLEAMYPKLFELEGDALVFWSVSIEVIEKDSPKSIRFSGGLEIHLPLQKKQE